MEKVSTFISKKVISLEDGNLVGYVLNVFFDEQLKTFEGLIVVDEESENTFVLNRGDIVSNGQDCIMIDNNLCLQFNISSYSNNPIGKQVYDCYGVLLGRVKDIELYGKSVKKIITDKCEFPQRLIRKAGENFIIFGSPKKTNKKKTFVEQVGEEKLNNHPKITISAQDTQDITHIENPIRLYANPSLLLGKIVTSDIIGFNNELIAKKFDVIDKKIINKASLHNKLNLLTFYSK